MPKRKAPEAATFGQRLVALRKAAAMTQQELADEIGVSRRMLAYYEGQHATRRCIHRTRSTQAPQQSSHQRLREEAMSMTDQVLLETLKSLPAQHPALEAVGVAPMSEEEVAAEIKAARAERRTRLQATAPDADRS